MTANSEVMNSIAARLANNGLTSAGTPVLRITGSGRGQVLTAALAQFLAHTDTIF
jgi:hypothetical protein